MTYFYSIFSPGSLILKLASYLRPGNRSLLALLSLCFLFSSLSLQAEGTKQVAPLTDDIVMLLVNNDVYGNFAAYNGPESSRLYFRIKSPEELVYLGLSRRFRSNGQPITTGAYSFRIKRASDDAVVHGPFTVNSVTSNANSWEEAALGPAAITGQGYETTDSRYLFNPAETGDYYIEFENVEHIGYWDITVAANGQIQPGRLFSTNWAFRTPVDQNIAPDCVWDREFNGILYSYTSDGFVTKIDFSDSGFQGLSFNVAFNTTGPGTSGDPQADRMSVEGENLTENSAEHLIFLSAPDVDLFPDGECGSALVGNAFQCVEAGGYCLEASVTQPGQIEVVLDFNRNGEFDEGLDIRLVEIFDNPNNLSTCIPWDGFKGDGTLPDGGTTVNLLVQYTQGIQHWALFDGEFLKNGFCVEPVRPICDNDQSNLLYWDDRNITDEPGTSSPKDGRVGCDCTTENCRTWDYFDPNSECSNRFIDDEATEGYGDKSTLNTWWFARNEFSTFSDIPFPGVAIEGETEICLGEIATLTAVPTSTNITSITWEGPDGFISIGGAENTSVSVTADGTYLVRILEATGCSTIATHDLTVTNCPVDVELDKSANNLNPEIGQTINFQILITNKGPGIATGITVEDVLPDGLTNVTGISNDGVLNGNLITWSGLVLEEGTSITFTYSAVVGLGLNYTNLAEITTMDQGDIDSTPGNGVDTNGNGVVSDDPGDEDDGDGVVLIPQECSMGVAITNILCDDSGTPIDPSDDTFTFEVTVNAANASGVWVANDPAASSGTYGQAFQFGPYPIDGGIVNFQIEDDFFADCSIPISVTPPTTCSDLCFIETSVTNVLCNDNGTPSDPNDDTYTFDLTVDGFNTGNGWSAGGIAGNYGSTVSFGPFLISDGATELTVVDNADGGCVAEITIQAPPSCSGQCSITAAITNEVCDDNGTPSDPNDDVFYFDILVNGSNVSAEGWVASNGLEGAYGTTLRAGPYPISEGGFTLDFQDKDEATCTASASAEAPSTCSDVCLIEAIVTNIRCDDNGTLSDETDDVFYFDVTVNGLNNTGTAWSSNQGQNGNYGELVTFGPFPITAGGSIDLVITDNVSPNCVVTETIAAPPSCSNVCNISASIESVYCDDNGTDSDASDDVYFAEIIVTGSNTSAQGFTIGTTAGQYGTPITVGPFPIADGNVSLTIVDQDDPACTTIAALTAPATCSDECEIFAEVSNIICDDNGTPTIDTDDVFYFDVVVTGFNFGASWQTDEGAVGTYGVVTTLGPFPIGDGGSITTNITDGGDGSCSVPVTVQAPATCSNTCDIVDAGLKDVLCNDNGTPADPTDDTYTFVLQITGNNVADGWSTDLGISGAYGAEVTFGPYPIAEGGKSVTITDNAEAGCQLTINVEAPTTCSEQCAIEAVASDILCLDSNTPSHKEDDVFEFKVVVTALNNGGSGWIADDGTTGNYGETVTFGPYPISEGNRTVVITSADDPECQYILNVQAPEPCSNLCLITAEVQSVVCDDKNTTENSQDDTFTYTVLVTGLNTGATWVASDGTTGTYGTPAVSVPHPVSEGAINITIIDSESDACTVSISAAPPPIEIECPEDAFRGTVLRNATILEGSLEVEDARFAGVENLCWLETDQFEAGDHYYDLYTIQHTSTDAEPQPQVFTFYLFSDIQATQNLPLGLDGTGGVFFGPYYPEDPCCFLQTSDVRSRPLDIGQLLDNPQISTEGLFSQPYEAVVKFTVVLAPNQIYSLVTTSLSAEITGDYAWLVVSEPGVELEVVNGDVDVEKRVEIPVSLELTFFDRDFILNNPASTSAVGSPIIDSYCGVDSIRFADRIIDLGECEDISITRQFKVYGQGKEEALDSCEQKLTLRRPGFDDLVFPPEAILYACDSDYDTLANGFPAPSSTGYPIVLTLGGYETLSETHNYNLTVAYKDNLTQIPGSFTETFRRDWTILDICNDTLAQYSQLIKIGGFTAPVVECPTSNHYCPILEGNIMLFPLDPFECTATVNAPLPDIFNTCGEANWQVRTEVLQVVGPDTLVLATFEPGTERIITGLEPADYIFRYTVFDDEDHSYEKLCIFRVADTQEPTAVCQNNITFDLSDLGSGQISVDQINKGSSDNCGVAKVEIRRVFRRDAVTCDSLVTPTYSEWGQFVDINCCDFNQFVTIEMRVTDIYGLENMCWLDAKIGGESTQGINGLNDVTVSCSDLPNNFNPKDSAQLAQVFGFPSVTNSCGGGARELPAILNLSECGSGTIQRRFQAIDPAGAVYDTVLTQLVTINEFLEYEIGFPADAITDCVNWSDTLILQKAACDSIEVRYDDVFLDPIGDECYRIARTYHVISHCEWDGVSAPVTISRDEDCNGAAGDERVWALRRPAGAFVDRDANENNNVPGQGVKGNTCDGSSNQAGNWRSVTSTGYWTYTQEIRVSDNSAPVISFVQPNPICTDSPACTANVVYPVKIDDACALETFQLLKLELDANADGTIDADLSNTGAITGDYPNFKIVGDFPIGSHEFVLTVTDFCNNTSTARLPFEVIDCYVPDPTPFNEVVLTLAKLEPPVDVDGDGIPDMAGVTVSAEDLVSVGAAECSLPLKFSLNRVGEKADINRTTISFTCEDRYSDTLEVYVWDSAFNPYSLQPDSVTQGGPNYKKVQTIVYIQDPNDVCPDCSGAPVVEGTVITENGSTLPTLDLDVSTVDMVETQTDKDGGFSLSDLPPGPGYTITPRWDEGHRNGVSTMDLMLIRAHILGSRYLGSPYKMIAADVNNSGNISTADLLELRQMLLGESDRFQTNTSWRFVDMHYVFPDTYNPWEEAFPESVVIDKLITCVHGLDFAAIKIGDVNETASFEAVAFGARGVGEAVLLNVEDQHLRPGEEISLPFELLEASRVQGFQFTLDFNPDLVEVIAVSPALLQNDNIGRRFASEGALTFSWDQFGQSQDLNTASAEAFSLRIKAKAPIQLSDVFRISSRITSAEAYRSDEEATSIQLQFDGATAAANLRLHQNRPNPFGDYTIVGFDLPEAGKAEIQVMDISGRLVWQQDGEYAAGYNETRIEARELPGGGMFYYSLRTNQGTLTKKFIVVNSQR